MTFFHPSCLFRHHSSGLRLPFPSENSFGPFDVVLRIFLDKFILFEDTKTKIMPVVSCNRDDLFDRIGENFGASRGVESPEGTT
jgi:hypothetical protein